MSKHVKNTVGRVFPDAQICAFRCTFYINDWLKLFHCGHGTQFKKEVDNGYTFGAKLYIIFLNISNGSEIRLMSILKLFVDTFVSFLKTQKGGTM